MTDAELDALEAAAKAAKQPFPCCCYSETDNATTDYIAAANPATILELIAELRHTKAERDWLVDHITSYWDTCPTKEIWEKCTAEQDETYLCKTCWLKAAKEATCQK